MEISVGSIVSGALEIISGIGLFLYSPTLLFVVLAIIGIIESASRIGKTTKNKRNGWIYAIAHLAGIAIITIILLLTVSSTIAVFTPILASLLISLAVKLKIIKR